MVVGHTKFEPDHSALPLANAYNKSDCFSLPQLVRIASAFGTSLAYDRSLLWELHPSWSRAEAAEAVEAEAAEAEAAEVEAAEDAADTEAEIADGPHPDGPNDPDIDPDDEPDIGPRRFHPGIPGLFRPIPRITELFSFLLMANDGEVVLRPVSAPADKYPGATSASLYYVAAEVEEQMRLLIRRSLCKLLLAGNDVTHGVGSGTQLLPKQVAQVRPVWCFVRPTEDMYYFMSVAGYSKFENDAEGIAKVSI